MKYFLAALAITALPLFAQLPAPAPVPAAASATNTDPNKVVLTVGDEKITAAQYDDIISALPAQYQAYAKGPGKRAFADQLVQLKILAAQADKDKLDQDPKIAAQIRFNRQDLMARVMFQNIQDHIKVDDAAVRKYYDEHKNEYEMVKARHILIRVKGAPMPAVPGKPELTDEEAKAKADSIRKRLAAGEDFAMIAKAESDDTGSAANGGDLGEFKKGMMVPPFEQAAFAAKVGEITDPVNSPFGYHIIKVEAHTYKPLAEVKADIESKLKPELARKQVEAMTKSVTVDMDPAFFPPSAPPAQLTPRPTPK